ncbi:MAG: IS3 family transposase [Candidatus Brocadiaceae bacterium]|nr:IS3 family transposase [Candidatus Brocadiaceae bacterium]
MREIEFYRTASGRCLVEEFLDTWFCKKDLSIRRQCGLLGLHTSNFYYDPVEVSGETLRIMHRIDEIFTECPFYGRRLIREALRREGFAHGRESIQTFMRQMELRAIYPNGKTLEECEV